jgi:4-aminobutyrate aminotransferase-like enzyme
MFIAPPLTITREDIDDIVDILDRSLAEVERELGMV